MREVDDIPALKRQSPIYPPRYEGRVPKLVRMRKTVRPAMPDWTGGEAAEKGREYPVTVNSHGAVAAVLGDDGVLGLKPDEFEVVEWHGADERAMTPQPPPPGYRWEPGYQAYYHNPGCDYHGHKVVLEYPDPCGAPGWAVKILDPKPGRCDGMSVDEKNLWVYA